jgi:hypothetical protein
MLLINYEVYPTLDPSYSRWDSLSRTFRLSRMEVSVAPGGVQIMLSMPLG